MKKSIAACIIMAGLLSTMVPYNVKVKAGNPIINVEKASDTSNSFLIYGLLVVVLGAALSGGFLYFKRKRA